MAMLRQPMPMVRLRTGGIDDLDQVMGIMSTAFHPCFGEAWTRSQCAGILPMSGVRLTIADDNNEPIGFSLARAVTNETELLLLAVKTIEQRRGIGQILLDDFIANALATGVRRLHLEVRDGNPAIKLYCGSGFAPVGLRRNYYHGPNGEAYDAVTLLLII